MANGRADRRVIILFYLLTFYVLLQFSWWAYLLVSLNTSLYGASDVVWQRKVWMVVGEGSVFLCILLVVIYIMQRTIRKELRLVRQQRNFLLSITHEFKTPLSAIQLSLETITKRKDLDTAKKAEISKHALDNTSRLSALVDNVMLATRIENGQETISRERVNIASQVAEVVYRLSPPAFRNAENPRIQIEINQALDANVDRLAFDTMVGNLLDNALKYGNDSPVLIAAESHNGSVHLRVSDGGSGIGADKKALVFDRFYRIQNEETRSQKGTGLGLYIVSELASLHGGSIKLLDREGGGSTFEVSLPSS